MSLKNIKAVYLLNFVIKYIKFKGKKMKQIECYFVEYEFDRPIALHYVIRPHFSEKDGYRQSLSFQSFCDNEDKKLLIEKELPVRSFVAYKKRDMTDEVIADLGCNKENIISHMSIWDFYNFINYNYKKKKFN